MGVPPKPQMRGLQQNQEVKSQQLYRDTRTTGQKIGQALSDSWQMSAFFVVLLLLTAIISTTFFVLVSAPLIMWVNGRVRAKEQRLPLLLPTEAGITDYRDAKPGRIGYYKSRGEYLMGNARALDKPYEMWLSFAHKLTHTLLLGATGSGKTEALVSEVANYLAVGSGVMYSDAKAAPKLGWQIFTLARYFGREDDFRALNYIKGNTSIKPDRAVRRGNNVNLFAHGNAESITQVLISLMPPGGNENKVFSEKAISLISSIMPALVDLRDRANLKINPGVIRKALEFEEIEKLKRAKQITPESREAIRAYLQGALSGYKENPKDKQGNPTDKQDPEVYRQHGFGQAYFTRALASLSDTYADTYMVGRGEISFLDIILRRRICVVMIPALEKAPEEMKNLAKIVLAAQKNAISTGIPPDIEGRKENVLDNLPTTSPVPFGIINDEFAFMMVSGYGTVLAQARGLYCAVTVAGQDYAGMKREDPDEAEQIAENTKLKIVMASEGLGETRQLIEQIAGEGYAAVASGYAMDEAGVMGTYLDSKSANFEKRSRVDVQDTRSVVEGEGIVFWRDTVTPWKTFYHGIDEDSMIKDFQIHRLLDVDYPTRGPGAALLAKESDMAVSMKRAVNEGLDLGLDGDTMPPFSENPSQAVGELRLDLAIRKWRSAARGVGAVDSTILKSYPGNNLVRSEGLLIAAISSQISESLLQPDQEEFDEEILVSAQPYMQQPASSSEQLAQTVQTLAPPLDDEGNADDLAELERALAESDFGSAMVTGGSLSDRDSALDILSAPRGNRRQSEAAPTGRERAASKSAFIQAEMERTQTKATPAPTESETLSEAPFAPPEHANVPILQGEPPKGSGLLDAASWIIDPNRLQQRLDRPVSQGEIDFALRSGGYAGRIEQALGSSVEESRRINEETAVAIARTLTYPKGDVSTPQKPENQMEEAIVIRESNRTLSSMKMWLDNE